MNTLKQHPPALFYLCMTEMWERFGFYVVQGMLVLFMSQSYGYSDSTCYTIQGLFTGLAYISPILGGLIADRLLGFKTSIIFGGAFLSAGYILLALPNPHLFYFSLATIIVGNGLFKPNISSLLGTLYKIGDPHREAGFTLFYIGINVGVLLAGISSGYMKDHFGWSAGFGLAGLGLLIGLFVFSIGVKKFASLGHNPHIAIKDPGLLGKLSTLAGSFATIFLVSYLLKSTLLATWLFPILGISLLVFLMHLAFKQNTENRRRLFVLYTLIISSIVFWMFFIQIFFSANLFIDRLVNKSIFGFTVPTTVFYAFESVFVILLGPLFAWAWSILSQHNSNPSSIMKFIAAIGFVSLAFWTLFFSTFFTNDANLVNPIWIVLSYFCITVGELLLSPIGLSAVTSLAPRNLIGMMMGVWFVATGFGGQFAGDLAKLSSVPDNVTDLGAQLLIYRHAFFEFALIAACITIVLFIIQKIVKSRMQVEETFINQASAQLP